MKHAKEKHHFFFFIKINMRVKKYLKQGIFVKYELPSKVKEIGETSILKILIF